MQQINQILNEKEPPGTNIQPTVWPTPTSSKPYSKNGKLYFGFKTCFFFLQTVFSHTSIFPHFIQFWHHMSLWAWITHHIILSFQARGIPTIKIRLSSLNNGNSYVMIFWYSDSPPWHLALMGKQLRENCYYKTGPCCTIFMLFSGVWGVINHHSWFEPIIMLTMGWVSPLQRQKLNNF